MEFYTPIMLAHWLGNSVLHFYQGKQKQKYSGGIRLIDGTEQILSDNCLYLGDVRLITKILKPEKLPPKGVFIITGIAHNNNHQKDFISLNIPENVSLIETSLPLFTLYNQVQEYVHRFLSWDSRLHEVVYASAGLQKMLDYASDMIDGTILLVNAGYKNIASVCSPDVKDPSAEELMINGYQSFDTILAIHRQTPLNPNASENYVEYVSDISNNYTMVHLIRHQGNLAARLCIILNGPKPNPCTSDLGFVLAHYVADYMFNHLGADYGNNSQFGLLAADLIECRLTDPAELEQRLKQIQLAVRRYYHVMLVEFPDSKKPVAIPWNYIINQLEYIFPFSNITTYQGDILLIIRKTKRSSRLPYNQERLLPLLEQYNGYAAIGNASEFLTSLPPVYHQTKEALRLGRAMNPEKRVFYYEDYSVYHMIELAAESARQQLGSRNLVHLCNNALIALVLYDKKKGTNLAEVLYAYLSHERNTSETAKALYVHRNTMLYKIHQIEEIIGDSLDNPLLRERLMFSYHVLEYMKLYQKSDILELKPTQPPK